MELSVLNAQIEQIKKEAKAKETAAIIAYCKVNNPYKVGDIFTDHIGSIEITAIGYSFYGSPCCTYTGIELLKNGQKNKLGKTRVAHQSNEVKQ